MRSPPFITIVVSFPVAPFGLVVAMRELLSVGDAWVDPRDVAGISRGVGADALTLTVHTFPPRGGLFRRRGRDARRRVDHRVSFGSVVELIEARDRILAECHPPGSLWSDPANADKRLLVLVNPAAGKGRGLEAYERDVAPVLACLTSFRPRSAPASPAGGSGASPPPSPTPSPTGDSRVDVRVTARRGDAQTAVATLDLDAYAAVVCVGGDGTLAEIFNGLMSRRDDPDAASVAARFPIGVIPAGSGNAVAKSIAELHGEPCDRTSAALAVARGGLRPIDRAVVADPSGAVAMHSLLSLSWGFFADVDIESERFRWLGGLRFTLQAIVRILFMRRYRATAVRFRPAETFAHPDPDQNRNRDPSEDANSAAVAARRAARSGATAGVAVASRPGWREITGDVQGVWALSLPWGAEDMHAAPAAEASDGAYDVLIVSGASKLALLGLLLVFDAGGHVNHPAVTYVKASAFEISPGTSDDGGGGYVAVDGELVAAAKWERDGDRGGEPGPGTWRMPYGETKVEVMTGGATVFAAVEGKGVAAANVA